MSNVKRSTYQKVVEENKRLKKDLRVLAMAIESDEGLETYCRLRTQFLEEEKQIEIVKDFARVLRDSINKDADSNKR